MVHLEDALGDSRAHVLRPRLDVAQRAALEEHREHLAAEAAVEIVRLRERAQLLRHLHEDVLARDRTHLILDLAKLVGANVRERAHAALRLVVEPIGQHFEEAPAVIEAGGRVLVHRLVDEILGIGRRPRRLGAAR